MSAIQTHARASLLNRIDADSPIRKHAAWFYQSLRAGTKSEATCQVYLGAVAQYDEFARREGMPRDLPSIERDHLERFMLDQLSRLAPASAAARYSGLRAFFSWAVKQGQIDASPMAGISNPQVPDVPVATLTDEQVRALLRACDGKGFKQRRDTALLRFMLDTGTRRSEAAGLKVADLDLTEGVAVVTGKGNRTRTVAFGAKTASAIYAYLIERDRHRHTDSPYLWLGQGGRLSGDALAAVVARRAGMAGIANPDGRGIHPHQLRHTFADRWLTNGGSEGDLMQLGGWRSSDIMRKYGRSRASARAIDAARRMAMGDAY